MATVLYTKCYYCRGTRLVRDYTVPKGKRRASPKATKTCESCMSGFTPVCETALTYEQVAKVEKVLTAVGTVSGLIDTLVGDYIRDAIRDALRDAS